MQITGTFICLQIVPPGTTTIRIRAIEAETKCPVEIGTTDRVVGQALVTATLDHTAITISGTWDGTYHEEALGFMGLLTTNHFRYVPHITATSVQNAEHEEALTPDNSATTDDWHQLDAWRDTITAVERTEADSSDVITVGVETVLGEIQQCWPQSTLTISWHPTDHVPSWVARLSTPDVYSRDTTLIETLEGLWHAAKAQEDHRQAQG